MKDDIQIVSQIPCLFGHPSLKCSSLLLRLEKEKNENKIFDLINFVKVESLTPHKNAETV